MRRRTFLGTAAGIAGVGSFGTTPVLANGRGNGRGKNGGGSSLVNAERTDDGAIVATDDGFVISGQEISVEDRDYHTGDEGTYVVYNDGYSGTISNNEIEVEEIPANPTFGIRIEGGNVTVASNTVRGDNALANQFLSIGYADGATGKIEGNTLHGGHRVGILAEGAGTDVHIRNNEVTGLGPKSDGWAENGIQVTGGATPRIRENTVTDHWWDLDNFQSSGIILYQAGDGVNIQSNTLRNNDAGLALWGGGNHNAIHNTIEVSTAEPGKNEVAYYGAIVLETTNAGIRQNRIDATDGDIGILVYPSAENTKLIGNDVSGFDEAIVDEGEETKLPDPFDPDA